MRHCALRGKLHQPALHYEWAESGLLLKFVTDRAVDAKTTKLNQECVDMF
jgi:hypothetical protein